MDNINLLRNNLISNIYNHSFYNYYNEPVIVYAVRTPITKAKCE